MTKRKIYQQHFLYDSVIIEILYQNWETEQGNKIFKNLRIRKLGLNPPHLEIVKDVTKETLRCSLIKTR